MVHNVTESQDQIANMVRNVTKLIIKLHIHSVIWFGAFNSKVVGAGGFGRLGFLLVGAVANTETVALEAPVIVTFALECDPFVPGTIASKLRDA